MESCPSRRRAPGGSGPGRAVEPGGRAVATAATRDSDLEAVGPPGRAGRRAAPGRPGHWHAGESEAGSVTVIRRRRRRADQADVSLIGQNPAPV
jgi:hypothetical protein